MQLPVSALPEVDYPTIQVVTFYPGRSRGDGLVGNVSSGASVRPGSRPEPDDLDQFIWQFGHHAAVRPRPEYRRRRAAGAGGDQFRATYLAGRSSQPADLQQGESSGCADSYVGVDSDSAAASKVEDLADTSLAQKISQLPGVGLVSISGGQKPAVRIQANPTELASYGLSLEDLRAAWRRQMWTRPRA